MTAVEHVGRGLLHEAPGPSSSRPDLRLVPSIARRRIVWRWIGRIFLVVPVLALLALGLGPRTGAYRTLTVLTGSMSPAIPAGSVIVARPIAPSEVRTGDVVVFNAPIDGEPVVTHRVTSALQRDFALIIRTQGDANDAEDPWNARIGRDQTVWRVTFSVPWLGRGISALGSPGMKKIGLFVVPFLAALLWLREIWSRA